MDLMPRVLILHASVGTGHERAAVALADAFARKQEGEVRVEDTLDYGSQIFRQAYSRSYIDLSERSPMLWRLFYETTDASGSELTEMTNRLRGLVERLAITRLERFVTKFAPAAIVCTHFLPVELLLRLKQQGQLPQPIYCVVTDFFAHSFWVMPGIDGYFVGSEMTRDLLAARGVVPAIIRVSWHPDRPKNRRTKGQAPDARPARLPARPAADHAVRRRAECGPRPLDDRGYPGDRHAGNAGGGGGAQRGADERDRRSRRSTADAPARPRLYRLCRRSAGRQRSGDHQGRRADRQRDAGARHAACW